MSAPSESEAAGVRVHVVGRVGVVTLDRPEKRNALDLDDRVALLDALRRTGQSSDALVLTGSGPMFCAGGDLRSMTPEPEAARHRLAVVGDVVRALVQAPVPVVSAVEGGAFGLGLSLALAADVVIGAYGSRYAASFSRMGLGPDGGLSWSLPRRVGPGRAGALVLTARTVGSDEALDMGLVDELVEPGAALDRALEVAAGLADLPPAVLGGVRRGLEEPGRSLEDALAAETEQQVGLLGGAEFARRREAFLAR